MTISSGTISTYMTSHLILVYEPEAAFRGIPILAGCIIANPDGTGFGNGLFEGRILNPMEGDQLRLHATDDVMLHDDNILFREKTVARNIPIHDPRSGKNLLHSMRLRFAADVYFEPVAAIASALEFVNSDR